MLNLPWSCLYDAFCVVVGKFPIEHNGSELIWPQLPEPMSRRGFHIQEIINALWPLGWAVVQFERDPLMAPNETVEPIVIKYEPPTCFDGVVVGMENGIRHALAWHNQKLIDPIKGERGVKTFNTEVFYAVFQIKS